MISIQKKLNSKNGIFSEKTNIENKLAKYSIESISSKIY